MSAPHEKHLDTSDAVVLAFEELLQRHPGRAVAYSAIGIVHALIEKLDGPGATEKVCRQLTALDKN